MGISLEVRNGRSGDSTCRCDAHILLGIFFMNDSLILSLANFAIINELHSKACGEGIGQELFKKWAVCTDNALKTQIRRRMLGVSLKLGHP